MLKSTIVKMSRPITLVTGNQKKLEEFLKILGPEFEKKVGLRLRETVWWCIILIMNTGRVNHDAFMFSNICIWSC